MPNYLYKNEITGEIVEIFQNINELHFYEKDGVKYERIFTSPQIAADTKIDPLSQESFSNVMGKKRGGTIGSLWDQSKELSIKREEIVGVDQVKEKYYQDYSKRRNGRDHPDIRKQKILNSLNKKDVIVEE